MNYIGKIIKEFIPDGKSSRKSEGAFYRKDDGTIYFVFSHYRGNREDGGACDLAVSVSTDDGKTFSDEKVVLTCEECGATNIMSVSLLRMQDGTTGMFYLKKSGKTDCRMFLRRTTDFVSFSDETEVISDRGFSVVNNDRVLRLKDGSIIVPSAFCDTSAVAADVTHENLTEYVMPPAVAVFWKSADDGKTFFKAGKTEMPHKIFTTGLQEPVCAELDDGRLVAYFRNNSGRQYVAFSSDRAKTWTEPQPSVITSPPSPMSLKRLSDGRFFAVYNPIPLYYKRGETVGVKRAWTGARTPLVAAVSNDGVSDFKIEGEIETDKERGFCYCAVCETPEAILLGYCAGGETDGSTLARTRIRRIEK